MINEELRRAARKWLDSEAEVLAFKARADDAMKRLGVAQIERDSLADDLLECVDANKPERYIVFLCEAGPAVVRIHQTAGVRVYQAERGV